MTGLVIAGTGGILLWDGLRDHDSPNTAVGVAVSRQSGGMFVRRTW